MTITHTSSIAELIAADAKKAPLFHQYRSELQPQPAYIEIDEDGNVSVDYSGETGSGVPMRVWNRRDLRISVPGNVQGRALHALITKYGAAAIERLHAGHSVEWDGSNYVGRLTQDASEAFEELERAAEGLTTVAVWSLSEWLGQSRIGDLWPEGKTIEEAVASCMADIAELNSADDQELAADADEVRAYLESEAQR